MTQNEQTLIGKQTRQLFVIQEELRIGLRSLVGILGTERGVGENEIKLPLLFKELYERSEGILDAERKEW